MKPYTYYSSRTIEFPSKADYTVVYYYKNGKLLCVKRPFCNVEDVPSGAIEETVFDEVGYDLHRKAWTSEKVELEGEFKEDLIKEEGLTPSEKVDKCFNLAWQYGCSQGLSEVHAYFVELVDLIR